MENPTYIPSELIEPVLVKWWSIFITELGFFPQCPPKEWWKNWEQRATGVSILVGIMLATHASIAFSNFRRDLNDESKWPIVWETARTVVCP
jgi:hypothetical protein